MSRDTGRLESDDTVTISRSEYERMQSGERVGANPEPAFEEGPHLKKAINREAKLTQMREAGFRVTDDRLTDDMRSILEED